MNEGGSLASFALLDTCDKDAIAINKLCKLNFNVFYHVLSYKSAAGLSQLCLVCY